jgi:hypothetical protein
MGRLKENKKGVREERPGEFLRFHIWSLTEVLAHVKLVCYSQDWNWNGRMDMPSHHKCRLYSGASWLF